jgi:hypothetical protein
VKRGHHLPVVLTDLKNYQNSAAAGKLKLGEGGGEWWSWRCSMSPFIGARVLAHSKQPPEAYLQGNRRLIRYSIRILGIWFKIDFGFLSSK